jgi:DNA helicase II / ATP-dependent DNA helicase PcrA
MAWNDGLEGPALEIASAEESPLLALAGPGTGKTFSLIHRVARLLEQGCPPDQILVVTFARTAAQDLLRSLRDLQPEDMQQVSARTLHGYCFSLLNSAGVLLATRRVPRILADFERKILLADLEPDEAFGALGDRQKLTKAFEAAWARRLADTPGDPVEDLDQAFQDALLESLRWHKAMLVGELVPIALHYLHENPAAPELRAFQHVVINEFQDINKSEQELLELLAASGTLTVIGDDDQSIYSFKWANPDGIRTFEHDHPGTRRIPLEECRRCPTLVVGMASNLISRDPHRLPHALLPRPTNVAGEVHVVQWTSVDEEAAGIAAFVAHKIAEGVPPGECLVLAPNRLVGYGIRDAMRAVGIDARSYFKEEPIDDLDAQEAFTLLNLLGNPDDRVSLRVWLSFRSTTQRRRAYRRALQMAKAADTDANEILRRTLDGTIPFAYGRQLIERWQLLQARLAALRGITSLEGLIDDLFPDGVEPVEDLRALAIGALPEAVSVAQLAAAVRTSVSQPQVPIESTEARVMSFYKSKGLTARLVVLAGLVQGLIPGTPDPRLSPQDRAAFLEEQRRLFYVGLTRTTRVLVLSSYVRLPIRLAMKLGVVGQGYPRGGQVRVQASEFVGQLGPTRPRAVIGSAWTYD